MSGMVRLRNWLRTPLVRAAATDEGGIAATEFALILPIFALFIIGIIDMGSALHYNMRVQTAAHAGMQYAVARGFNSEGIQAAVQNATNVTGITMPGQPERFCGCPGEQGVTASSCGSSCPGGSVAGTYVRITAQGTYRTYFTYPGLANEYVFSEQATVRIQ